MYFFSTRGLHSPEDTMDISQLTFGSFADVYWVNKGGVYHTCSTLLIKSFYMTENEVHFNQYVNNNLFMQNYIKTASKLRHLYSIIHL